MSHAKTILIAGTASHVGKSTVAAGLCRVLADSGVDVAPFKAQNMSNNARAVPIAFPGTDQAGGTTEGGENTDEDGVITDAFGEIGVSQYVQARAARVPATTDHNPVLLKPRGDGESQLVIHGEAVGHFAAGDYFDEHWQRARAAAEESWQRLAAVHDVVVAEGAGSIAEINLHDRDLANVETARFADADVVLVADIERGGVFASLVGTLELMPADLRERVVGCVITKFRGDRSLLDPGIEAFEARTGIAVLGVVPYDDPGLPEEDSVALPAVGERANHGADDGVPDDRSVTIAVPRFPRASNVTDLEPLAREPGVRVEYVPLGASLDDAGAGAGADAVVLSGTKNTVDDLLAARDAGLFDRLRGFDGPIVGLCGGYQLLGERVTNAAAEGTGDADEVAGAGLLPVETRFSPEKRVAAVEWDLLGCGPLAGAFGSVTGYEIHAGESTVTGDVARPFPGVPDGAATDRVLGTYLHGLFENRLARDAFLDTVFAHAGLERPAVSDERHQSPYDRASGLVREHVELGALGLVPAP